MNRMKIYEFDISTHPYRITVKATSIIEAKKLVANMGYKKAYFTTIKWMP
jgi:hypothetical protein